MGRSFKPEVDKRQLHCAGGQTSQSLFVAGFPEVDEGTKRRGTTEHPRMHVKTQNKQIKTAEEPPRLLLLEPVEDGQDPVDKASQVPRHFREAM